MEEKFLDNYPRLDLSPLLSNGRFAVHCANEYEAECLLAEMKRSYPKKCRSWDFPNVCWHDKEGDGQLYFPDINNAENITYCWTSMGYSEISRYIIIECCMLFISDIMEESELPIDFLMGG